MSKKSKLILATAVFGASLFGASCGGGDGGGTTAGTGTGGGGGTPSPTEEGKVLALLEVGTASAGTFKPVTICQLKSDNKAHCGNDLNPSADVELEYLYEFPIPNGNVVLKAGSVLYFFNGSQVVRPTSYRALGATSDTPSPGGINIPSGTVTYYAKDDFVIIHSTGGGGTVIAVSKTGKVIKDTGISSSDINTSCEAVAKGTATYKLNTDGTSSNVTATIPDEVLVEAGDRFLVKKGGKIYLSSSECSITGAVEVVDIGDSDDYDVKMVKVGNDFYIAVRDDTDLYYYRVSGNTVTDFTSSEAITLNSADKYYYALDGRGRLYAITDDDTVSVFNIDGTLAGNATETDVTFTGLLGLADRALAKASGTPNKVYEITISGSTVNLANKGNALYTVVDKCTDGSNTISVVGAGTNFIRCAHDSGLYSLTFDSGSGLYSHASHSVAIDDVKWATGKVLVKSSSVIKLCSTTTTPSISCSNTDLPDLDPTDISLYLKFNGLDVFYTTSSGVLKVGNVFDPPSALPITVSSPSGGNASFDLNKFAFSFGPSSCRNQIVYFSSRTASPKRYTITMAQPSNACVDRILKVFP
jgi:hypothetical protein